MEEKRPALLLLDIGWDWLYENMVFGTDLTQHLLVMHLVVDHIEGNKMER